MQNKSFTWRSAMLRNPHLLTLVIIMVLVAGFSALSNLPRLEDPRITMRNALVITAYPGASAERVEILVTDVIEEELQELHEIKTIRSTSRAGMSVISLELQDWVTKENNATIFSKIRDQLDNASLKLPAEAQKPVFDDKRGATAFTLITALTPKYEAYFSLEMLTRYSEELADRLRNSSGTELVRVYGDRLEEIVVAIDPEQLLSTGISAQDVARHIALSDSKVSAGVFEDGKNRLQMQVEGELTNLNAITELPVTSNSQGNYLRVSDIASVSKGYKAPADEIALINGKPSIFVAARMQVNQRVDHWSGNTREIIKQFTDEYAASFNTEIIFDQNQYTEKRLGDLSSNLLLGSLLVIAVVFVFMGLRAALIVGLALPLSSASTLFGLTFFDEQIHQMSIFGIIIAIGLLIDNAIVMTDEVRKQLTKNPSRLHALEASIKQLFVPLSASTFTTVLGFMPIFLLPGNVGDFVGPIAISVILALISSLLLSLTVIASLAALFTPVGENKDTFINSGIHTPALLASFRFVLTSALRKPLITVSLLLLLPIAGVFMAQNLGNVFFPSADRDQFELHVWLPEQSHIQQTATVVNKIDAILKQHAAIKQSTWLVGGSNPSVYYNQLMNRDNLSSYAHGIVTSADVDSVPELVNTIQQAIDIEVREAKVVIKMFGQGPPVSAPISFELIGRDLHLLAESGRSLRAQLESHPQINHSFASLSIGEPEISFQLDNDAANLIDLSRSDIATQLRTMTDGVRGGTLIEGNKELPIRVKMKGDYVNFNDISALPLISPQLASSGQWTSTQALGELTLKPKVRSITHLDGERVNQVEAFLRPGAKAIDVSTEVINDWLNQQALPKGVRLKIAGESDKQGEAIGQLGAYLPVLLVLMLASLILSFRSVAISLIIGAVALLSMGLGLLSLSISGLPIGFNPLLGLAGLVGVAINGSIVVIAAIMKNPKARAGELSAIVDETVNCCRHIISTTITTVGGFIPLLLWSEGTFWPPLAVVIAGGVGFSIVLSLLFTPLMMKILGKRIDKERPAETYSTITNA